MELNESVPGGVELPAPIGDMTKGELPHVIHEYMEFLAKAEELKAEGPLFTFLVDDELWVFLNDPELYSMISKRGSNGLALGPSAEGYQSVIGNGLPANFTTTWRRQRLIVSRALSPRSVRLYCGAIARLTSERVAGWSDGAEINVHHEML